MAENKKNNQQQLQVSVSPEVAKGLYSNFAMINHSHSDFIIDFAQILPGVPATVGSRVIMAPEHAKALLAALQENVARYEQQFGTIQMGQPEAQQAGPRTIAPFGNGQNEA